MRCQTTLAALVRGGEGRVASVRSERVRRGWNVLGAFSQPLTYEPNTTTQSTSPLSFLRHFEFRTSLCTPPFTGASKRHTFPFDFKWFVCTIPPMHRSRRRLREFPPFSARLPLPSVALRCYLDGISIHLHFPGSRFDTGRGRHLPSPRMHKHIVPAVISTSPQLVIHQYRSALEN
jgi:hypothetical protein